MASHAKSFAKYQSVFRFHNQNFVYTFHENENKQKLKIDESSKSKSCGRKPYDMSSLMIVKLGHIQYSVAGPLENRQLIIMYTIDN